MNTIAYFWGKVIVGHKRGRKLGFPTANVRLHKQYPEGVYISQTTIRKKTYQSATFIGSAKTYGESDYKAETYILQFNGVLYGKWIRIRLTKKLRENAQFNSESALVKQMHKDIQQTKDYFLQI